MQGNARPAAQGPRFRCLAAFFGRAHILLGPKHRGIAHSPRGKHGGYALSRPAEQIVFAKIIPAIDGPLALSPCARRTAFRKCGECVDEKTFTIRKVLRDVRNASAKILESLSLADLKHRAARTQKIRLARGPNLNIYQFRSCPSLTP
jgi:Rrf2 family protein